MKRFRHLNPIHSLYLPHELHPGALGVFDPSDDSVHEKCFQLAWNLSKILSTGMSMVLSKWIITPIKVGWIRPVSR